MDRIYAVIDDLNVTQGFTDPSSTKDDTTDYLVLYRKQWNLEFTLHLSGFVIIYFGIHLAVFHSG